MIGKNLQHDSAKGHVSGESIFVDDRAPVKNEIYVGVLTSPIAKGRLLSIESSEASEFESFIGIWTASDVSQNKWGPIVHEQPLIVEDKISYMDEVVGIFATSKREEIEKIRSVIKVNVSEESPIFSIRDAREADDIIYKSPVPFAQGDFESAYKNSEHQLEGEVEIGGQEHFYLESQAAIAYPQEFGQMEVHCSSQHPSETQRLVAEALGVPFHFVTCIVKRMGGGFGGKESQAAPFAAYAAIVANKTKKPARLVLTKDEDMKITGKRHPFLNEFKVGFDGKGKINALKVLCQSDGGAYADLSSSILERAMFHVDGAYYLENCQIDGISYRTNNISNTAFRGFGGPQGAMVLESIIEDIANKLNISSFDVRLRNLYKGNESLTPYGQKFENNMLPELFSHVYESSDYQRRLGEIKEYNQKNVGSIRGISATATKFGIAFTARFLNQGSSLVNLQLDGSAQVSTGATEMGQGVNTKIQQIVCHAFGISSEKVQVMTTSTEKNHNTSPTAASSGSDINGAAALMACNKIKARLSTLAQLIFKGNTSDDLVEFEVGKGEISADIVFTNGMVKEKSSGKEIELIELISKAYFNRISLGAQAFYKTPGLGFSKDLIQGKAFNYFTQGVAVTEVQICEYTGETKILRADIEVDLGRPLNPGIDKGQVTGAYIQGVGWVTSERLSYSKDGKLLTYSPTTYKIPNAQDMPREFNVNFIENNDNNCNVHKSKAVGEPPFLLGISAWTSIKNALSYRSKGQAIELSSPATNEEILLELTRLKKGENV